MKRAAPPPTNYAEHRDRWSGLIHDIHHAVAAQATTALSSIAERSLAAENCWTMVAPFPRGLVCRMMTRAAYVWARQTDPAVREAMTPLLMASVGLVDQLMAETAGEATTPPTPTERAEPPAPRPAPRLPYVEG